MVEIARRAGRTRRRRLHENRGFQLLRFSGIRARLSRGADADARGIGKSLRRSLARVRIHHQRRDVDDFEVAAVQASAARAGRRRPSGGRERRRRTTANRCRRASCRRS